MILKTPQGKSFRVLFLTSSMRDVLVSQAIPFSDVSKLASYHQKVTFSEIAHILKFQYVVAQQMGVPLLDPKHLFGEGYNGGMVERSFNDIDSETLTQIYKSTKSFACLDAGMNTLIVLFNGEDASKVPGWDSLEAQTFSGALLETVFAKVGYMESHNGKIPKPNLGEFTLAEVYKLVSIENP
jgi:hypothetical protein